MIDDDVLVERVAESLRAHARAVTVPERPFDPTRRMAESAEVVGLGEARLGRRTRPRAAVRLAVAAAVLLVALAVGVHQLGGGPGGDDETVVVAMRPPQVSVPADGLAATWRPDGWRIAQVDWSTPAGTTSNYGPLEPVGWDTYGDRAQLFADRARPGAALLVESGGGVMAEDGAGEPITVRGHQGRVLPSPDRSDVSGPRSSDVTLVTWIEGGAELRASFRGMGIPEALAALDGLVARSGGPAAGFDAPRGGDLALTGEAQAAGEPATQVAVGFEAPGSDRHDARIGVLAVSPVGRATVPYLVASLYGERAADGTATFWDASAATRTVVRPDGQAVDVEAFTVDEDDTARPAREIPGVGPTEEVTDRVAGSVEQVPSQRLTDWWDEVNTRRMRLPLQARVSLPTATIEVRGEGDNRALCQRAEPETVCALVLPDDANSETLWTTLHIGGEDYEVAASPEGAPLFVGYGDDGAYAMDAEAGSDRGWHVALARPADGMTVIGDVQADLAECLADLEFHGHEARADELRRLGDDRRAAVECENTRYG